MDQQNDKVAVYNRATEIINKPQLHRSDIDALLVCGERFCQGRAKEAKLGRSLLGRIRRWLVS